jgi:hypothetical protein
MALGLMKAPILLAFLGLATAQAAEPTGMLTLACEGTMRTYRWEKDTGKSSVGDKPVSMNIAVNFTARKVEGSQLLFGEIPDSTNELTIEFERYTGMFTVHGTLNRMTGELHGEVRTTTKDLWLSENYSLKCKPTQQMF